MSRIIVKNLPSKTKEKRLREMFSRCGEVTDIKLMKTRSGAFRRFGFVGFVSEAQAEAAMQHYNNTFIDASKITVEIAKPYGDTSLSRPWSKYAKGSSAYQKREKKEREGEGEKPKDQDKPKKQLKQLNQELHKSKLSEMLGDYLGLKSDPEFQEFLEAHKHKSKVQTWADDSGPGKEGSVPGQYQASHVSATLRGDKERQENSVESEEMDTDEGISENVVPAQGLSDMEYLRSKMVARTDEVISTLSSEEDNSSEEGEEEEEGEEGNKEENTLATTSYTLKMLGLPFRATEEDVKTFFHPITVAAVRFTSDDRDRPTGRAYADFSNDTDLKKALRRDRDCIGRRYIELFVDEGPQKNKTPSEETEELKPWEVKAASSSSATDEGIAESGRLFVRNLPFSTTEEHLTALFGAFGPLTEVTTPLDKNTNKPTGLAFVTFMLPEHAVKAFNALDGQIFQGRLLHILPAKARQNKEEMTGTLTNSSYKKQKEKKLKSLAGSGHNWNTLFLGANAVVDAMAERYATEKSAILDPESSHSAAVRMALGETQLISETRAFLTSHGVKLDVFEQSKPKRSKTVLLAKNLPFGTQEAELHKLFAPFGSLNQIILPPAGISALVEFLEPTHAKAAFQKVAYTKFKHLPLYLEWAPLGVVSGQAEEVGVASRQAGEVGVASGQAEEVGVVNGQVTQEMGAAPEDKHSTVFVKNLNFSTDEESLGNLFSKFGKTRRVSIARKRNMKDPSHPLSISPSLPVSLSPSPHLLTSPLSLSPPLLLSPHPVSPLSPLSPQCVCSNVVSAEGDV